MARTSSKPLRTHRTARFQTLESRALMAGDVGVKIINGDLVITGDTKGNDVAIVQTIQQGHPVAGSFFITGLNGTTINKGAGRTFTGVTRDFLIDLGSGSDKLKLGSDLTDNKFIVPRDLSVKLGDGNNVLQIKGITVSDDGIIIGGANTDKFDIRGSFGAPNVDNGLNDLTIIMGNGIGVVNLHNSLVRHDLSINTGTDTQNDSINLSFMSIGHNATINTGAGRDVVRINEVGVNATLRMDTGADHDAVFLTESQADVMDVNLGSGIDELHLDVVFGRQGTFNGGADPDLLFPSGVDFIDQPQFLSFGA